MKSRSLSLCFWLITAWLVAGCGVEASETPPVAADVTGINDNDYTEMVCGKLSEGQLLVTGIR